MSAEKIAKLCADGDLYSFSSAGLGTLPWDENPIQPPVRQRLEELGAIPGEHRARQLTAEMLQKADLVVAMDEKHKAILESDFDCPSVLFMEVASGEAVGVDDVSDRFPSDWQTNPSAKLYMRELVDSLHKLMPRFLENLERWVHPCRNSSASQSSGGRLKRGIPVHS